MKRYIPSLLIAVLFFVIGTVPGLLRRAWSDDSGASPNTAQSAASQRVSWKKKYKRPASPPFPADNAYSKDRERLGKILFFDPRLSGSGSMSCASCHNPALAWGDGLPKAIGFGMKQTPRRTPTILNSAWSDLLFWDGRADSLENQALGPMLSRGEMHQDLSNVIQMIEGIPEYKRLFALAYPGEPIDGKTIARAIATYERTVVSGRAPFDEWISGKEGAITTAAKRGFDLFNGKAHCAQCHSGWNFTDNGFHDIGVEGDDVGRGANLHLETMQYAFKTPTLRNIDRRAPYMHDGSEQTLEQVVEFYDQGTSIQRPSIAPEMVPLHLTAQEKHDLVAFLKTLTSPDKTTEIPALPR